MMTGIFLLLAAQAAAPTPISVPTDWAMLAPLPYLAPPQSGDAFTSFVSAEVAAGRCPIPRPANGHWTVRVEIAALVAPDGSIRRAVPRAIDCPTVEQYSAGLVTSFARANLPRAATEQWYRATIVYDWNG